MGGDTNISQPSQPSYGEGLSEALQAQVGLLTGTGDFASTGSLESLLPLEESIRRKTAQADTDILRQTLLGGETGGEQQEVTYDEEGRIVTGTEGGENYQIKTLVNGEQEDGGTFNEEQPNRVRIVAVGPDGQEMEAVEFLQPRIGDSSTSLEANTSQYSYNLLDKINENENIPDDFKKELERNIGVTGTLSGQTTNFSNITKEVGGRPVYAKDSEGNIIQDKSKAGTTETTTLPTFRTGDGMVDILGDKRGVQDIVSRDVSKTATQADVDAGKADAVGETFTETVYEQTDAGRQAGFATAEEGGGFLGLSALAEDLQAGNLSRQRERDLLDVARLSGTYQDIMEDYKPGTQKALADARGVLQAQTGNLTGAGAIDLPTDSTFGGKVGGEEGIDVAGPTQLTANTAFNEQLGLEDGTLRSDILTDAQTALGQGLTDRERDAISEAFKARSTMMGRTFDQSAGIAEAEARVAEDNARRMQNRAFAQSVLGQEAGLQQGDITRGMGKEAQQAQLQQQVNMTQADVDMRAALANQAQQQQAGQFQQATTADAQRLNEQLKQSGTLGYIDAATRLAALEDQSTLDPFQAVLGRGGGQSLQAGQSVFGQAGYGLNSGPQYLNPEAGLGFIQNQAANAASMYNAQVGAEAAKTAGLYSGLGSLGGGLLGNLNVGPFGG
tara:strand:+ start:1874 stop:3889 length:2016 start_codon:yes stop_codon:yes gene_type:complete